MLNISSTRVFKGLMCASLSLFLAFSAQADDDDDRSDRSRSSSKSSLSVSPTSLVISQGSSGTASVSNASGNVSVSTSRSSVATAKYDKRVVTVKGIKAGNATITVKDSNRSRTISVTVTSTTGNLSVSTTTLGVTQGSRGTFTVSGASGTVSVSSSDSSVASVSYAGGIVTVTGLKVGSATVTVKDSLQSKTVAVTVSSGNTPPPPPVTSGSYSLLAWNDLGMHCVDGKDYSVFSILPPYNNLHAQLVNKTTNKQVNSGVTLTYESYADNTVASSDPLYGSINTISSTKTNFWTYVQALFGAQPAPDYGLNLSDPAVSNRTPGTTPSPMQYSASMGAFVAEGIPIMPVDDSGRKNFYPMIKVVAKDATGAVLATARTVLPVSDEMTCKGCHSTTTSTNAAEIAARPAAGWINDPDPEKDWKKNILRLHDEKKFADTVNQPLYVKALAQVGYSASGLLATATAGKPVLCAACHSSNALQTSGVAGVRALTHALHSQHATVKDPATQAALGDATNRSSCYTCHPGSVTQCLRGAMSTQSMSCQSCHGTMAQVGNTARAGWFNEPNCQSCHHDGKREVVGVDANGLPKVWTDTRFATNANTPMNGVSLFRFSQSHGNLQCEACHGATHAEYPSTHSQDNALSMDLQGHTGTVAECTACHATIPTTVTGGPHGMHTTGDAWVSSHKSQAKSNSTACAYCHGADYRGTPLSQIKVAKTINKKSFPAGHNMNCYDCHNGPNG
jgi:hypothetical protein